MSIQKTEVEMPILLIRDLNESTKKQLAIQAAKNGRSQQAEALAILEDSLEPKATSWFDSLQQMSKEVGGIELPTSKRHSPRLTGVLL